MNKQLRRLVDPFSHVPLETSEEKWWQAALGLSGYLAFAAILVGFIALALGILK